MLCKTVRDNLNACHAGELGRVASWRVLRHLHGCPLCHMEYDTLRRMNALLRASDIFPNEIGQERKTGRSLRARRRLSLSLAGGLTGMALLSITTLTLTRPAPLRAEAVGRALGRVNTWHLRGWRLIDGKRIPWDIWGRKTPYFYREESGSTLFQTDGKTQIRRILSDNDTSRGREAPTVIIMRVTDQWTWQSGSNLSRSIVDPSVWTNPQSIFLHPRSSRQTGGQVTFRFEDPTAGPAKREEFYTVDSRSQLPVHYEARASWIVNGIKNVATNEALQADYDVVLPKEITSPQWSPDARVIDATRAPAESNLPRKNTVSAEGVTTQATPIAVDGQGRVLVRVRGWLADIRLRDLDDPEARLHMELNMSSRGNSLSPPHGKPQIFIQNGTKYTITPTQEKHVYADDREQPYLFVQSALTHLPDGDWLVLFAPLEPIKAGMARPHSLRFTLAVTPATKLKPRNAADSPTDTRLFTKELTWTVALPNKITDNLVSLFPSKRYRPHDQTLEAAIAFEISTAYYMSGRVWEKSDPAFGRKQLQKALYWTERRFQLTTRGMAATAGNGLPLAGERYRLGGMQAYAGEYGAAEKNIRLVLAETKRHKNWSQFRRMAEHALRHIKAPDAWASGR